MDGQVGYLHRNRITWSNLNWISYYFRHVYRVRIDGGWGFTPQFPCLFHCDPPTPQLLLYCWPSQFIFHNSNPGHVARYIASNRCESFCAFERWPISIYREELERSKVQSWTCLPLPCKFHAWDSRTKHEFVESGRSRNSRCEGSREGGGGLVDDISIDRSTWD